VEASVRSTTSGVNVFNFNGPVADFLVLGTMMPGDYVGPQHVKIHMPLTFPEGIACYHIKLVVWVGGMRAAHSDTYLYLGGRNNCI